MTMVMPMALVLAMATIAAAPDQKVHRPAAIGSVAQWFGPDAYPAAALSVNEQGRVGVQMTVDAAGKPASCKVVASSGSYALDSGTCDIAMAHLVFAPATDEAGRPIAGMFPFSIVWRLPDETDAAPVTVPTPGAARR